MKYVTYIILLRFNLYNKFVYLVSDKVYFGVFKVVYDRNYYFGLGQIPKLRLKLVDTFGRNRNRHRNYILKKESS